MALFSTGLCHWRSVAEAGQPPEGMAVETASSWLTHTRTPSPTSSQNSANRSRLQPPMAPRPSRARRSSSASKSSSSSQHTAWVRARSLESTAIGGASEISARGFRGLYQLRGCRAVLSPAPGVRCRGWVLRRGCHQRRPVRDGTLQHGLLI